MEVRRVASVEVTANNASLRSDIRGLDCSVRTVASTVTDKQTTRSKGMQRVDHACRSCVLIMLGEQVATVQELACFTCGESYLLFFLNLITLTAWFFGPFPFTLYPS